MSSSPLSIFNRLVPKDPSRRLAQGLAYGGEPRQRLDLYAPRRSQAPLPVVVFVYGGSWSDGDRDPYSFVGRAFAAKGFLTAIPDYRLVPHIEYPAFIEDVAAAITWVKTHAAEWGGDPERIVVVGHSAGAYNGVMAIAEKRYLAQDVRASIRGFAGLSGPYDFFPFTYPITIRTFGQAADPRGTQPVDLVDGTMPPVFLGHGLVDKLVYPKNTIALARVLRERGVPVTERLYEGLGHPDPLLALARPLRWRAPVFSDVVAFARAVTAQPQSA